MRKGNVVRWEPQLMAPQPHSLWIISEWETGIVDEAYTIRCKLISFDSENVSAGLSDKHFSSFHIKDLQFVAPHVKAFIMGNVEKALFNG